MNRKLALSLGTFLLGCLCVAPLYAADGLYIGAGIGKAGIKDNINTDTFDSDDAAYKAFIGWRFKTLPALDFAIEGAYTDFGKPSQTLGGQRVERNLTGPSIAGLGILSLGPIDLYGKLGAINWDMDTTSGGSASNRSGTDGFYGLGLGFYIWKLGFRAEYERFQIKDVDRVDLLSVSALFQF